MFGLSREMLLLLGIMLIAVVIFGLCLVFEVDEIMMPEDPRAVLPVSELQILRPQAARHCSHCLRRECADHDAFSGPRRRWLRHRWDRGDFRGLGDYRRIELISRPGESGEFSVPELQ
jgi:hypothetical protein